MKSYYINHIYIYIERVISILVISISICRNIFLKNHEISNISFNGNILISLRTYIKFDSEEN